MTKGTIVRSSLKPKKVFGLMVRVIGHLYLQKEDCWIKVRNKPAKGQCAQCSNPNIIPIQIRTSA